MIDRRGFLTGVALAAVAVAQAAVADVEVGDALCGMRFSEKEKVLYLRDAKGADFAKVGSVRFIFSPPVARMESAAKVSDRELRRRRGRTP